MKFCCAERTHGSERDEEQKKKINVGFHIPREITGRSSMAFCYMFALCILGFYSFLDKRNRKSRKRMILTKISSVHSSVTYPSKISISAFCLHIQIFLFSVWNNGAINSTRFYSNPLQFLLEAINRENEAFYFSLRYMFTATAMI